MWQDWSSLVMASTGISGPFVLFTSLGLLWFITWTFSVTSDPKECSSISKSELRLIQAGKSEPTVIKSKLPPLSSLFAELPTWAIIFANITNNWGYFVLLSWMPVYFKTVFNVNLKQAAWFSAVPWATVAISGYLAGAASDYLIRSGLFHNISKENHAVNWFCWSWSCIALLELREDANSCHIFDNRLKLELFQSSWLFTEYARYCTPMCRFASWNIKFSRDAGSNYQYNWNRILCAVARILPSILNSNSMSLFCHYHLLESLCYWRKSVLDRITPVFT